MWDVLFGSCAAEFGIVAGFVVDAEGGGGAGGGEEIDGYLGEDFVGGPGVGVGPVVEFLVDPCEQADGPICQCVAEGLGFGPLLGAVAGAFL